ncbi:MAG: M81 family metallopeptidase [Pseudomonadales bacterium]|jgi:microcystin degradation protein MlrC|nr:M81 family metallopeptidase [Pseudomonadales bacterium]MDP6470417.1 M81 family metallopeptidase [Pseudomonadales bacterium]MDP6827717.1 M81 family metallopeptidase [Pseudomonadales bacterium]MDP6973362.1 M81 family metallopeptidase [Pseudomonadales bacterium]|tara:strand:- start:444 stop:1901 length:1458 start_codon:yes stop_codon:yes gene_type:complete
MKIAIGGIAHETNTYCKGLTVASDFHQLRAHKLLGSSGRQTDVGGAVDACQRHGAEVLPLLHAWAQPSGTIERATYEQFKQEILDDLSREVVDGVYLALHGAGVVDGLPDLEGDLAASVREVVGDVPVAASFDLHGNVTQAMADHLDGVFVCHHYPHIDMHQQGERAIDLIVRLAEEGRTTRVVVRRIPALLPTTTTFEGIGEKMLAEVLAVEEAQSEIIDVSWFHGFPYTDVPHVGSYVAVTATDVRVAQLAAQKAALAIWNRREAFRPTSLDAAEAVQTALARIQDGGPVVMNETSDNCGGGAPGDGTHLLRALLEAGVKSACFGFVVDPEVAMQAHAAGVGAMIDVELGGKYDDVHGDPLPLHVYVKALHDGRLVMRAMGKGTPINLGPIARLVVDGMDIVVASVRSQTFDVGPFVAVGIEVTDYDIVALKSSNHFRAGFQDLASSIVTADPPGLTTHHIEVFPRRHCAEALWPVDTRAEYP